MSPVKHNGKCNSAVAFATVGAVETCFKRVTNGTFSDLSEQQLIDCGFDHKGAEGCSGARLDSYLDWLVESGVSLVNEDEYPYLYTQPKLSCPADLDKALSPPGAQITDYFMIRNGTEDQLRAMVVSHGAVISSVAAYNEFKEYEGGVFAGCKPGIPAYHAVLVVGYGTTEEGEDYWLVKNSWGVGWGEKGFMLLQRGVNMCSIGHNIAGVECE